MRNFCRSLDLFAKNTNPPPRKAKEKISILFIPRAATNPRNFLVSPKTRIICLFQIFKGVLLFLLGFSLLFLNSRPVWLDQISDWADDQLLLAHSKTIIFLLNKLQDILAGGALRATGILALFYCAVLFTEGIGVYMQKRWAEFLMIFATGALIPLEMRHVWHRLTLDRPIFAPILLLLANCFIVWFLYLVLRRDKLEKQTTPKRELIETR